jgi:hypothetical protein
VVDLRQIKIAQIPQIQNIPFSKFAGLAQLPANVIPGLSQIKLPDMPGFQLNGGIALMKLDVIRTKEKNIRHMVMSGSNQQPNAKCDKNCDYAEFHPWVGMPYLRGAKIANLFAVVRVCWAWLTVGWSRLELRLISVLAGSNL